jgi:protein-S-isoprenylcysteine O-methyltransferase Ste14
VHVTSWVRAPIHFRSIDRRRLKLAAYFFLAPPPHLIGYVVAPLTVSRLRRRHGWHCGRPRAGNLLGLVPLVAGAAFIVWAAASHYAESPTGRIHTSLVPEYLVRAGAYTHSRNPMYVGGALMWVGWATLLGSPPVAGGGIALFAGMATVALPMEERMLHRRFGPTYDAYRERVPRWLKLL